VLEHRQVSGVAQQLADKLQALIEAGELKPTRAIPSESQLCETFDIARGTVRKAVEELRGRGLVFTVPRRGTFVVDVQSRHRT
jgi:GntR family transcriptional regulator